MDIYTTYRIPFEVGTWARGHKFDITAVRLSRALIKIDDIEIQIAALQKQSDKVHEGLAKDIMIARTKMETHDAR